MRYLIAAAVLSLGMSSAYADSIVRISGSPATTATVGKAYYFRPAASDSKASRVLFFAVSRKPSWASFDARTGTLSGTPQSSAVGKYAGIVITVSDIARSASLPAFNINVTGGTSGGSGSSSSAGTGTTSTTKVPTISGTPSTSVVVGSNYSFTPTAKDPTGRTMQFFIVNKPTWASFSSSTGALTGKPTAANVGSYAGVNIGVSDDGGKTGSALTAFTIAVKAASGGSASSGGSSSGSGSSGGSTTTTPPPVASGGGACTSAMTGSHATYNVGPGKEYTEVTAVPWLSMQPGDVVNIFYRSTPYAGLVGIKVQGTASAPFVVNGVTDSNCNRPEVTGTNAQRAADRVSSGYDNQWSQDGSVFYIWWGNGGWANKPKFITIQNLRITSGTQGSSGINAVTVKDLLIQNCEITNVDGWGVFVNTKDDQPNGEETSYRVTLRNNKIYNNGISGSFLYHNLYIQAHTALYEGNYIGQLRAGAQGSSLKDRSSGTVVRYNTIVAAARALDLVETEGGHGTVDTDPNYNTAWVYGNLIIDDDTLGPVASHSLIHWGYDNTAAEARTGTLYFYDNTVALNMHGSSYDPVALFDQQSNNSSVNPHNLVQLQNNVIWQRGTAPVAMGRDMGQVSFVGKNWITSGWINGNSGNSVAVSGQSALIQGTNPGLDATSFRPASGSTVIGQAAGTTPTSVTLQPASVTGPGMANRASAKNLGAFE